MQTGRLRCLSAPVKATKPDSSVPQGRLLQQHALSKGYTPRLCSGDLLGLTPEQRSWRGVFWEEALGFNNRMKTGVLPRATWPSA